MIINCSVYYAEKVIAALSKQDSELDSFALCNHDAL